MSEDLEKQLRELDNSLSSSQKVSTHLQNIFNLAADVPSHNAACCYATLFHLEYGILKFLKTTVGFDQLDNGKGDTLRFLTQLFNNDVNIKRYIKPITDICLTLLTCEKSAKVKKESLLLLNKLANLSDGPDLEIENLINKIWTECLKCLRYGSMVRGEIYNIMGVFAMRFPQHMSDKSERLLSLYLNFLHQEVSKKQKPELLVIAGCLNGLAGYLVNFTQSCAEGSRFAAEIFKYIRMSITITDYSRYEVPKAALRLLSQHAAQFDQLLTNHAQDIYNALESWSVHRNSEVKKMAVVAIDAFLEQVSTCISHESNTQNKHVVKTFVERFYKVLNSTNASPKELLMAVKGCGQFSQAFSEIMEEKDVLFIFEEIIKRSEQLVSSGEKCHYLPNYLEALASMLKYVNKAGWTHISRIEQLVVFTFDYSPRLTVNSQQVFSHALALFIERCHQANFSRLIYQQLLLTCAHSSTVVEIMADDEFSKQEITITYKSFLPTWLHLLNANSYQTERSLPDREKCERVKQLVFNETIEAVIEVVSKLNLTSKQCQEEESINSNLPNVQSDFVIFANLVDWFGDFTNASDLFENWAETLITEFIKHAQSKPFISGFYRMLKQSIDALNRVNYFEKPQSTTVISILKNSVKEFTTLSKQLKDELLISVTTLCLSLPINVIKDIPQQITPVYKTGLTLGLTHYEVADLTLKSLERLCKHLNVDNLKILLREVLPYLDDYLQPEKKEEKNFEDSVVMTATERRGRRLPVKYIKALVNARKQSDGSPLEVVRMGASTFLGRLGGALNRGVLGRNNEGMEAAIAWDTQKHLSFALPFRDMKPVIYLDGFVPRVVELAVHASSRQLKVVSCELLHALTLYMLGTDAQLKPQAERHNLVALYKKVFPALIHLSCSQEQVSEQLFSTLLFGIIHWFTARQQYERPETIALLNALLDAVTDSSQDNSTRDFAAKCVKEFLQWSIKQSTPKQLEKNAGGPKSLFKRLFSLSCHPSPFKRLAAALIFNQCYSIFREEETLVNTFSLEMVIVFSKALAYSHTDSPSLGTVTQYEMTLQHLQKIVERKKALLFKPYENRRAPVEMKDCVDFNLRHVNVWLLRQCGAPQTAFRRQCMRLVCSFLVLQDGVTTPARYLEKTLHEQPKESMTSIFESGGYTRKGIRAHATLDERAPIFANLIVWLENLLGILHCYCWIVKDRLVCLKSLLYGNATYNIFRSLVYFIEKVNTLPLAELPNASNFENVLPNESEKFYKTRGSVIKQLYELIHLTLAEGFWNDGAVQETRAAVFSDQIYEMLLLCIMLPNKIFGDELQKYLPSEIRDVSLTLASEKAPNDLREKFLIKLTSLATSNQRFDILSQLPDSINSLSSQQCDSLHQLLNGYELLFECGLSKQNAQINKLQTDLEAPLFSLIMGCLDNNSLPVHKKMALRMLRLYLQLASIDQCIIRALQAKPDKKDSEKKRFYDFYSSEIVLFAVNKPAVLKRIVSDGDFTTTHIFLFRDLLLKCKSDCANELASILLDCLVKFLELADGEQQLLILEVLVLLVKVKKDCAKEVVFFDIIASMLQRPGKLSFKEKLFDCIPTILAVCREEQRSGIKQALQQTIANDFPISSADLPDASLKKTEYFNCLHKLVKTMKASNDVILFEVLLSVFVREVDEVYEKTLLPALLHVVQTKSSQYVNNLLDHCFVMFADHQYTDDMRSAVVSRCVVPVVRETKHATALKFFEKNIPALTQCLGKRFAKHDPNKYNTQLVTKRCTFKMLTLMFEVLNKEDVSSATSSVVKAYQPQPTTGKELTSFISKEASKGYKEAYEEESLELQRKYHCSAYNCLSTIISCTQTELKFYTGLLFAENPAKGSYVLENLIDLNHKYSFEDELTVPFQRKKTLQMIRKAVSNGEPTKGDKGGYMSTQYLLESSLSQDVMQFDFNLPTQAYNSPKHQSTTNESTTIEMDSINQHECMDKMLALITHMKSTQVYKEPNEAVGATEMPSWMQYLHKKMKSSDLNVTLFVAKIVVNLSKVFERFASFWFEPLVDLVLSGRVPGAPMNYFTTDIVVTVLSWSPQATPLDTVARRALATGLLEFLVKNCHHENRAVLKNNLHIIKTLVAAWKHLLECPYLLIHGFFSSPDEKTKDNVTGLQILGCMVANGFASFKPNNSLTEDDYLRDLVRNLSYQYKDVFGTCAEVCGLILNGTTDREHLLDLLKTYLIDFSKTKKDRFVICLYKIHIHYSPIVDSFIAQLLYCLSNLFGELKTQCVKCLAARVKQFSGEQLEDVYKHVKNNHLANIISDSDEETQLAGLKLAEGLMSQNEENVLTLVVGLQHHTSSRVRSAVHTVCMNLYDQHKDTTVTPGSSTERVLRLVKEVLLVAIDDPNTELSLNVLNFWQSESRLPSTIVDRITQVLLALYTPRTEAHFLSFSTNLLLQLSSVTPDFSLPVFPRGLNTEQSFRAFHVNFSWQHQLSSTLYAQSQQTAASYKLTQPENSDDYEQILRATQREQEFSQTQADNWMNPSQQISSQSFDGSQNNRGSFKRPSQQSYTLGGSFTQDASLFKAPTTEGVIVRRVVRNDRSQSAHYARLKSKEKQRRTYTKQKQKMARDRKVVMYRTYRVGELPDIMIKHSDVIVPLQALAQLDATIAQQLFTSLFTAVVEQLPQKFPGDVVEQTHTDLQAALDGIMQSSVDFHPAFVGAMATVCLDNKQFRLEAPVIGSASLLSLHQPLGVLLLEKQIMHAPEDTTGAPKAKRARHTVSTAPTVCEDVAQWMEVARLYDSVDDYDFLRSVFTAHISRDCEATRRALEAEAKNDYQAALQIYRDASRKEDWSSSPSEEERDYWDFARLRCFENLGQWEKLNDFTVKCIDENENMMAIWNDDNLQECYLPYYVRSNTKLLCQGKVDHIHTHFLKFVDDSLTNEETNPRFTTRYCKELAVLKILQDNYTHAKHFIDVARHSFFNDWSQSSKLLDMARSKKLHSLQLVVEMEDFSQFMLNQGYKEKEKVRDFVTSCSKRLLDANRHSIPEWDDVIVNRCAFLRKLKAEYSEDQEMCEFLYEEEMRSLLKIASIARKQTNFAVAKQYLKDAASVLTKNENLALEWRIVYAKVHCDLSKRTSNCLPSLVTAVLQLEKADLAEENRLKKSVAMFEVFRCMQKNMQGYSNGDCEKELNKISCFTGLSYDQCVEQLGNKVHTSLSDAQQQVQNLQCSNQDQRNLKVKVFVKTFQHCDEIVRESDGKNDEHIATMISVLLKAMALDSIKARVLFPRLLQLISSYPSHGQLFQNESGLVPVWMFLRWLNQIVALIDKPVVEYLANILKGIARNYPQALVYSLKVSGEQFNFEGNHSRKEYFQRLCTKVSNPTIDLFVEAIDKFTFNPIISLKEFLAKLRKLVSQKSEKATLTAYKDYLSKLHGPCEEKVAPGRFFTHYAKRYAKELDGKFGKDGKRLIGMSVKDMGTICKELEAKVNNDYKKMDRPLDQFSPWLSTFQMDTYSDHIEIPGQYTGERKPMVEYHVKISSFHPQVLVLTSIRKPKRLIVRGDDAREYKFLVKGGEDLRRDQRVQQVFGLMNKLFERDSACSKRGLKIRTYQVVPLTTEFGLIEWVDNTVPYKTLLKDDPQRKIDLNAPYSKVYGPFLKKYGNNYKNIFKSANRSETVKVFREGVALIPWDLLRRAFVRLSATPEAYFALRRHFVRSHACMSCAHYVMGVGDRHLENTLVDVKQGGVVGIDFGHTFGTASELTVPELIPFRLTQQMLNLILPIKDASPYAQCMTVVLYTLRHHSHALLSMLDVFVHEPLLDWLNQSTNSATAYPKERIDICKSKLDGVNPALVIKRELMNHPNKEMRDYFVGVAQGVATENVRKQKLDSRASSNLPVEEQVACLVDLATDPNVLGRAYSGWMPWI